MGIRTKLIRRSGNATFTPMHLDVTDLSITTDRNISAFALPVNNALKVGLDFNLPSTMVQIRGVLGDDDMSQSPIDKSDEAVFNCDIFPRVVYYQGSYRLQSPDVIASRIETTDSPYCSALTESLPTSHEYPHSPFHIGGLGFRGIHALNPVPGALNTFYSWHASNRNVGVFNNGDKIYNMDDNFKFLGTVINHTSNSQQQQYSNMVADATGTTGNELTGRATDVPQHTNDDRLSRFNPETFLHGMGFKLHPIAWLRGQSHNLPTDDIPIFFKFNADAVSEFSTLGSPVSLSLVSNSYPENYGLPTIVIPIKGLYTDPEITEDPLGLGTPMASPAASLAKAIEAAINSTLTVSAHPVAEGGGKRVTDAFTAEVDSVFPSRVKITSKDAGSRKSVHYNVSEIQRGWGTWAGSDGPIATPSEFYTTFLPSYTGNLGAGGLDVTYGSYHADPNNWKKMFYMPVHQLSTFVGGQLIGDGLATGPQSAGDKVQDLLGIFANSPVGHTNEIVGIQIPYQSLISASGVDAETRNFFLTYGFIDAQDKLSDSNARPASELMDVIDADIIERDADDRDEDSWFVDALDEFGLSTISDGVTSISRTLGNLWEDIEIALTTSSVGNTGGIRVIPSKFEYSYNAGNTEYTFNMLLSVIHNKIAP